MDKLRITEIFYSLQGESRTAGLPTVFIRLTGCPLRCGYCDTAYAFSGGQKFSLDEILDKVAAYQPRFVCVTGGEPLAQKACIPLLKALCDAGYNVSLETSGAIDISTVDQRVSRVMDIKTPGSLEDSKNLWSNIEHLTPHDQVKFVICHEEDYDWSKGIIEKYQLAHRCEVLVSPSYGVMNLELLADSIIRDNLPVRMQVQLHKVIWGESQGK